METDQSFSVICVAPENKEPLANKHLVELSEKYEERFIWLKNKFGEPETENLMVKEIHKRIGRN
jgi:hypothetical protein